MADTQRSVAVVTGAGRGLGRAITERLHAVGWAVAVTDIDERSARTVATALDPAGGTARAFRLDVASALNVAAVFGEITLVNNAGIYPDHTILDMAVDAWDTVMAVNLRGTFLCTQAFARARTPRGGGAIVNLASAAAFSSRIGASHYSASKAGVVMFTKSAAQEFGPLGLRVNAIAPGLIEVGEDQGSDEYRNNYLTMIPRGRTGRAEDIAGVVAFLLSDDADFVSGECLAVDGGFLAGRPLIQPGAVNGLSRGGFRGRYFASVSGRPDILECEIWILSRGFVPRSVHRRCSPTLRSLRNG